MLIELVKHSIRALCDSLYMVALVSAIILVFRLKNPTIRVVLYMAAVFRPLAALSDAFYPGLAENSSFEIFVHVVSPPNLLSHIDHMMNGILICDDYAVTAFLAMLSGAISLISFFFIQQKFVLRRFKRCPGAETARRPALDRMVEELAPLFGLSKPKLLIVETDRRTPILVGTFRPTIVISESFVESVSLESIRLALAHEFAHIKRGDNLMKLATVTGLNILFFSPSTRFSQFKIEREMEKACDSMAAEKTGSAVGEVAWALIEAAEHYVSKEVRAPRLNPLFAAFGGNEKLLSERVEALLGGGVPTGLTTSQRVWLALACLPILFVQILPAVVIEGHMLVL